MLGLNAQNHFAQAQPTLRFLPSVGFAIRLVCCGFGALLMSLVVPCGTSDVFLL